MTCNLQEKNSEERRLFFGCGVNAPWPTITLKGRLLAEEQRHMTLAFLGNVSFQKVLNILPGIPMPDFKIGLVGRFDRCLFLPEHSPNVVAWHFNAANQNRLEKFQQSLVQHLKTETFQIDTSKPFLPHVTICRSPFDTAQWEQAFAPLPCLINSIHLYESVGNLIYESRWQHDLPLPFEELDHTADIAFRIRGENMQQLYLHAQYALAFHEPNILPYLNNTPVNSLDHMITTLNALICTVDQEIGSPFKAVSYHGKVQQEINHTLFWEMIVDV